MRFVSLCMTAVLSASTAARADVAMPPPLDKNDLPDAGGEWQSIAEGLEFQSNPRARRKLEGSSSSKAFDPYERIFVDGADTYYDEYSQAWRVLGWYIDCDDCPVNDDGSSSSSTRNAFCRGPDPQNPYLAMQYQYQQNNGDGNDEDDEDDKDRRRRRQRRRLEEAFDDDDNAAADNANADSYYSSSKRSQCSRVLLWAAYVDLNYDGNQNTEYQFYNRRTNTWDTSLCQGSSTRCARMDCHLPDTNFELLGIFKDRRSDVWMSNLFAKQGDCVWSDEEYSFMNYEGRNNGLTLPAGCTRSTQFVSETRGSSNGKPLYYDIHPATYGRVNVGIYVDSDCITPYKGQITVEELLVAEGRYTVPYDSSGNATSTVAADLATWNDAFDAFKICQPCKAYDLTRAVVSKGFQRNYNNKRYGSSGDASVCSESAQPNFNQCKLFVKAGYSVAASYAEVEQAGEQGTIAGIQVNGVAFGRTNQQMALAPLEMGLAWFVLIGAAVLFVSAMISLMKARVAANRALSQTFREPLVPSKGVAA